MKQFNVYIIIKVPTKLKGPWLEARKPNNFKRTPKQKYAN